MPTIIYHIITYQKELHIDCFIVDLNLMPSVKFRAAMSESKSICGPLYIDFNSDWFALWFLRIKYVRKGNLLCWVCGVFRFTNIFAQRKFSYLVPNIGDGPQKSKLFTGYCTQFCLIPT